MKRRSKKAAKDRAKPAGNEQKALNSPFKGLAKLVKARPARRATAAETLQAKEAARPEAAPEDPQASFLAAVAGATRLPKGARRIGTSPAASRKPLNLARAAETAAAFADLMENSFHFDISDSEEYLEGAVVGLDPRLVRRLRRGEFSCQDYVDLHGMTVEQAREAVDKFIARSLQGGLRCILIIHGRGRNSVGQRPVLKEKLKGWLSSGRHVRSVLAFTTARPVDGGAGALYILLRRQKRRKHRVDVLEGAKR